MKTEFLSLEEALRRENIERLIHEINSVPTADEFQEKAEREMWALFLDRDESDDLPEEVVYEELPESSKEFIGLIEDGDGDRLPWWLESFEWRIRERGSEGTHQISANLLKNRIEDFHEDSYILPPKLTDQIADHLKALNDIGEEVKTGLRENDNGGMFEVFEEKRDGAQKESGRSQDFTMPDTLFKLKDNWMATSEEYKKWFDDLLRLSPPSNEALTAILLADSRVNKNLASETLSDKIMEILGLLGFTSKNKIKNYSISSKIKELTELRGVFDLAVPYPEGCEDVEAPPLVSAFFVTLNEGIQTLKTEEQERIKSWMTKSAASYAESLTDSELREFAAIAHSTPIQIQGNRRPTLTFAGGRYAESNSSNRGRYYKTDRDKTRSIKELLKELGLID